MLKLGCCLGPLLKFLATRLVATAIVFTKILQFIFDLIYVIFRVAVHFISILTKLELINTIF